MDPKPPHDVKRGIVEIAGAVIRFDALTFEQQVGDGRYDWIERLDRFEQAVARIADFEDMAQRSRVGALGVDGCYAVMFHGRRRPEWYRQRVEQVAARAFQ